MSPLHQHMNACRTEICTLEVSLYTKALFFPLYSNLLKCILKIQSKYGVIGHSRHKARFILQLRMDTGNGAGQANQEKQCNSYLYFLCFL